MDADLTAGTDAPPGPADGTGQPPPARSGRNLPVAAGVGVLLGGLVILTLFTVKATFLIFMGAAIGVGLWEMTRALRTSGGALRMRLMRARARLRRETTPDHEGDSHDEVL